MICKRGAYYIIGIPANLIKRSASADLFCCIWNGLHPRNVRFFAIIVRFLRNMCYFPNERVAELK